MSAATGRLSFGERQAVRLWALAMLVAPSPMFHHSLDLGLRIAKLMTRDRIKGGTSLAA